MITVGVPATTGVLRTTLKSMEVGDYIAMHWTNDSKEYHFGIKGTECPVSGLPYSSTGANYWYMVKIKKGLLVSDRVISHTYSWVNLNTAKLIQGRTVGMAKLDVPPTTVNNVPTKLAISPDSAYYVVSHSITPFLSIYKREGDSFTRLPNPDILPGGSVNGISFAHEGNYLAVTHTGGSTLTIYKREGDAFTKLPDPFILPSKSPLSCAFSPDGTLLATTQSSSPYYIVYKREEDVFTKIDTPVAGSGSKVIRFSPDGTYLMVSHPNATPYISIFKREGDSFTKLPAPIGWSYTSYTTDIDMSPDNTYMAVAHTYTPYTTIYKREGDSFVRSPTMSPILPNDGRGVSFSSDGTLLTAAHDSAPFLTTYKREGDSFIKIENPSALPSANGGNVAYSPDGAHLAFTSSSPIFSVYAARNDAIGNTIRTLTGGVAYKDVNGDKTTVNRSLGAYPPNNEWDKLIDKFPIELVEQGKTLNDVFHWQAIFTWSQDTNYSAGTNRTVRGTTSSNHVSSYAYDSSTASVGFRPVLEYTEK